MIDKEIHQLKDVLYGLVPWCGTGIEKVRYYYAESGLYIFRDERSEIVKFAFIDARSAMQAIEFFVKGGGK